MKRTLLFTVGLLGALAFGMGNASAQGKSEKAAAPAAAAKPAKPEKSAKSAEATGGKAEKAEKGAKAEKAEKGAKGEKGEKPEAAAAAMPAPPKPGAETAALKPFTANFHWTGTAKAGAYGPGSPEMPTRGRAHCRWTQNNFWAQCEIQDTAGKGKSAITWKATQLIGYDLATKSYVSFFVDNMGGAMAMKGTLEGAKLTLEGDTMMNGEPAKVRLTWDATDPKAVQFTDERSMKGAPFTVAEEATMKR